MLLHLHTLRDKIGRLEHQTGIPATISGAGFFYACDKRDWKAAFATNNRSMVSSCTEPREVKRHVKPASKPGEILRGAKPKTNFVVASHGAGPSPVKRGFLDSVFHSGITTIAKAAHKALAHQVEHLSGNKG